MRKCVILIWLSLILTPLLGQKTTFPQFQGGDQSSFQNYLLAELLKKERVLSKICDLSLGTIQFTLNASGGIKSLEVILDAHEEIRTSLHDIVLSAQWSPMKINDKAVESLPLVLPVYILIEAGCENGYIQSALGVEKDFKVMLLEDENRHFLDCLLLEPFSYNLPAGFMDLNPRKH